tara:strand:- start:5001 stop:6593 length:1593 start_codon:yes stop_codon:yes gene_type:complete
MAWVYKSQEDILKTIKDKEENKIMTSIMDVADDDTDWNVDHVKWKWPEPKNKKLTVKCDNDTLKQLKSFSYGSVGKKLKTEGKTGQVTFIVGKQLVLFKGDNKIQSSQRPFSRGTKSVSAALRTKLQEKGTAKIFDLAINSDRVYRKWSDIKTKYNGEAYDELKRIWKDDAGLDDVEDEWMINFFKQHKAILPEVGDAKFHDVNRDGGFMEFIEDFVVKEYKSIIKGKKDNWNPADIWLIKDEEKIKGQIRDACGGNKSSASAAIQLAQLNSIMRQLWNQKFLMGISLKKVDGAKATFKKVNISQKFLQKVERISQMGEYTVGTSGMHTPLCKLTIENDNKTLSSTGDLIQGDGMAWSSDDCRIRVQGGRSSWDFQIKRNVTSSSRLKYDNLKFEPTQKGYGGARMGKAAVFLIEELFDAQGLKFKNDKKLFPQDSNGFNLAQQRLYRMKISRMKRHNVDIGGIEPQQAVDNLIEVFKHHPDSANSKCMQISYMNAMFSLPKDKRDKVGTDMVFYASKEGKRFGPHGKIY